MTIAAGTVEYTLSTVPVAGCAESPAPDGRSQPERCYKLVAEVIRKPSGNHSKG